MTKQSKMNFIQKVKIFILLLSPISPTIALDNTPKNHSLYIPTISFSPPPPSPPPSSQMTPLKPSMAVIVAVLTAMFSITFLLLLYAKHCKRGNNGNNDLAELYTPGRVPPKNSGVDRRIIESLPVFRFGALTGEKEGLECAVCLGRFEQTEVLRLLPKCKHAFHVECVDTWLEAHSTCPLCRYRVEPEDILLVGSRQSTVQTQGADNQIICPPPPSVRRVSGRHSSAGERGIRNNHVSVSSLQILIDPSRRSCDNWKPKRERKDDALLLQGTERSDRRKLDHRIVIEESKTGFEQRWSDVQPSDLLYLRSEMIMSDSRPTSSSGSRPLKFVGGDNNESGRGVINERSVSEITGLSRFRKTTSFQKGVLSRWLAWVPQRQQAVMIDTPIHT